MLPLPSLSLRQRLLSETERHAVRTDDEVEMDAEDGHEPQRHQAEALQSPSHVLNSGRRNRTWGQTWRTGWFWNWSCVTATETEQMNKVRDQISSAAREISNMLIMSYQLCQSSHVVFTFVNTDGEKSVPVSWDFLFQERRHYDFSS